MRKGFPQGKGGMNMNMLKQAQKMQQDMMRLQEELGEREYTASAGGDAVRATVNGKLKVLSVKLSADVVDPDDIEMLEDLIVAAIGEASRLAETATADEMQKITGGLLPGMF